MIFLGKITENRTFSPRVEGLIALGANAYVSNDMIDKMWKKNENKCQNLLSNIYLLIDA